MYGIAIRSLIALFFLASFNTLAGQGEISLEQIWKEGKFSSSRVSSFRGMADGKHFSRMVRQNGLVHLVKYSFKDGSAIDTIINGADLKFDNRTVLFDDYEFNEAENIVLLTTETQPIYRRSSKSHYFVFDLEDKKLSPLTDFEKGKQEQAQFSPTSNQVAFVRKNNLFLADLSSGEETQITFDGTHGEIINGALDWVYEEEFSFHRGFYWSPEGTSIAFYRFDESRVKEFSLKYYTGLYPYIYNYKYPKAGEENSIVAIKVYDLNSQNTRTVDIGEETDQYIPRIKWTRDDGVLCVMRLNRLQNHLEFLLADVRNSEDRTISTTRIYNETSDTYIEINDNLIFLEDGEHFLWNSEKDGWNHIYLHSLENDKNVQITKGAWEVIDFYGADVDDHLVYFSAARNSTIGSEVYSLDYRSALNKGSEFDGSKKLKNLTPFDGSNDATFNSTFDFFVHSNSTANTAPTYTLRKNDGKKVRVLESNESLQKVINDLDIASKSFGTFKTNQGHSLNYSIIAPSDFDSTLSYPMILMIYGGPGSNRVSDSFDGANYFWHQMLAQKGYIVVSVDPRGTMRKGRDFKHSTYLNLGKLELEDFIETAKFFGSKNFVDDNRIGIMGWSYGGYMSSLALTKGADHFSLGIAVAPVTNWRYYDSIYTERFMRTPQENPNGYDDNSPINFVHLLKGDYMLVHGSADDNVHPQNTMEMVEDLVQADKQFDLFIYPNKNHGIYGGNTRFHLYKKMTDFIVENL
jgi:dipeptidyl-peptidase-4